MIDQDMLDELRELSQREIERDMEERMERSLNPAIEKHSKFFDKETGRILVSFDDFDWLTPSLARQRRMGNVGDCNEEYKERIYHHQYEHEEERFNKKGRLIPDYLPRDEVVDHRHYPYLPSFQRLQTYEEMLFPDFRSFRWMANMGNHCLLRSPNEWAAPEPIPSDVAMYQRHYDSENTYHAYGKYWNTEEYIPDYFGFVRTVQRLEYSQYRKWSQKMFSFKSRPYDMIFDSRFQHPTSHTFYSAIRLNSTWARTVRREYYCHNFDKIVKPMHYMAEYSAHLQHTIIVCEPSVLGVPWKARVMYFYCLHAGCLSFAFISVLAVYFRCRRTRHSSHLYMLPFVMSLLCNYIYRTESRQDACSNYGFWTTWTNDPWEQYMCFQHLRINPKYLREERMCFMQREDMSIRPWLNQWFCTWNAFIVIRELYYRFKYTDALQDGAWKVMREYAPTGNDFERILTPYYHRCAYSTNVFPTHRLLIWLPMMGFFYFTCKYYIRKYWRLIDPQLRRRVMIHFIGFRSLKGERRYMRMFQPLYCIFHREYPRDPMGKGHPQIMGRRFAKTTASNQYYY